MPNGFGLLFSNQMAAAAGAMGRGVGRERAGMRSPPLPACEANPNQAAGKGGALLAPRFERGGWRAREPVSIGIPAPRAGAGPCGWGWSGNPRVVPGGLAKLCWGSLRQRIKCLGVEIFPWPPATPLANTGWKSAANPVFCPNRELNNNSNNDDDDDDDDDGGEGSARPALQQPHPRGAAGCAGRCRCPGRCRCACRCRRASRCPAAAPPPPPPGPGSTCFGALLPRNPPAAARHDLQRSSPGSGARPPRSPPSPVVRAPASAPPAVAAATAARAGCRGRAAPAGGSTGTSLPGAAGGAGGGRGDGLGAGGVREGCGMGTG